MRRLLSIFLAAFLLSLSFTTATYAQASRTWVSGVGDDANPCSRTAPCKTFAGAISKTASNGQISVLDPGGFGGLTITKSIVIDGDGELASILVAGTNGIVISASSTDTVVLRNLHFSGVASGLDGVLINSAGNVIIDHCTFDGFTSNNIEINLSNSGYVLVQNSTIIGGTQGVVIDGSTGPGPVAALLKDVTIQGTGTALHTQRGHIDVTHSIFQNNATYGAFAEVGSINLEGSMFSLNGTAIQALPSGSIAISNVDIFNNTVGIGSGGGSVLSAGNNRRVNNTTPGAPTYTMGME